MDKDRCSLCDGALFINALGEIVHSSNGKVECPKNPYWWTKSRREIFEE